MSRSDRYAADRGLLLDSFGAACCRCGYSECQRALQFHHTDSSEKDLWSKGRGGASFKEIEAHPERFQLLCANCHFKLHDDEHKSKMTRNCLNCQRPFVADSHKLREGKGRYCSQPCQWNHSPTITSSPEHVRKRIEKYLRRDGDCWIWTGHLRPKYNAPMSNYTTPEGRHIGAVSVRSLSLFAYKGIPVATSRKTRTSCGCRECFNPDHIIVIPNKST